MTLLWFTYSDERCRGFWNLAKIEKTIIGKDGKTRASVICVYTRGRQSKLLRRPVQKLYPLEVNDNINNHSYSRNCISNEDITVNDPDPSSQTEEREEETIEPRRSRRSAAVTAQDQILAQSIPNNYH